MPHPQVAIFTGRSPDRLRRRDGRRHRLRPLASSTARSRRAASRARPTSRSTTRSALDDGYGFDTVLERRAGRRSSIPVTGEVVDAARTSATRSTATSTLEYALVFSKNIPSVDLFKRLGAEERRGVGAPARLHDQDHRRRRARARRVVQQARRDDARVRRCSRATAVVAARAGKEKNWVYVRRILDRDGNARRGQHGRRRSAAAAGRPLRSGRRDRRHRGPPQAIPARTALPDHEAPRARGRVRLPKHPARDRASRPPARPARRAPPSTRMFVAYTSRFTTVWMGDDTRERALGKNDAAYMTVVPLWARYMYEATEGYPNARSRGRCRRASSPTIAASTRAARATRCRCLPQGGTPRDAAGRRCG